MIARACPGRLDRDELARRVDATPQWDVIVVGGGATGLGCAVDAAARGHSVLLLEAHDFAKGTSSRSTKLIHGGVRYLAQGDLSLVREALIERSRLLVNAPHLVHPLRLVVPAYRWMDKVRFAAGLTLYDMLAGRFGIESCRVLDRAATLAALPSLEPEGLRGGLAFSDAQFDDARLAISLMRSLFAHGGVALNYAAVEALRFENHRVVGVRARDRESGRVMDLSARSVINATGVWADTLRRFERPTLSALMRPSQGVHLVVDRRFLPGATAMLVPETPDGRVLFLIPWRDKVLIGTTDTVRQDCPLEPEPLEGEVDFILATAARYLEEPPSRADVLSLFVGLRPLIDADHKVDTGKLSREHLIEVSPAGLITVTGGKWTTYRRMAEETLDTAEAHGHLPRRPCVTAELRLHGAELGATGWASGGVMPAELAGLPGADRVLLDDPRLTEAGVRHPVRYEMARTVEDVLARRYRLLSLDADAASRVAQGVAEILADELGHRPPWVEAQVRGFQALAARCRPGPGP